MSNQQIEKFMKQPLYNYTESQTKLISIERFIYRSKKFRQKYPGLFLFAFGSGFLSIFLHNVKKQNLTQALNEIEKRKQALSLPVYNVSKEENTIFPWVHNYDEWDHRVISITGRPLHYKAQLIPKTYKGMKGHEYIVPLVTKENDDGTIQEGVLLNKGWQPHRYWHPASRHRIEDAEPQTFIAYVNKGADLEVIPFKSRGTMYDNQDHQHYWDHIDLEEQAKDTNFKNQKTCKAALLTCIDQDSYKNMDERSLIHYSMDSDQKQDYPFPKTNAGALQLKKMPWQLEKEKRFYFGLGTFGIIVGLLV